MKSQAFVSSEDRFLIVDSEKCDKCGKRVLIYDGCKCDTEDAERVLMRHKVESNRDAMLSTLTTVDECDIYRQGLVRGEIRAFENVLEMLKEEK